MSQRAQLEIAYCDGGLLMAVCGPVCFALWQTKPTRELFEVQRAHLAAAVLKNPGRLAFLCVVSPEAKPPDDAERSASSAMINGHGSNLAAVACVIEGSGFRAAITRTVLSGMLLVVRSPSPIRLFETVELAASWLATHVGHPAMQDFPREFSFARERLKSSAA